jgi:hypothetical protein
MPAVGPSVRGLSLGDKAPFPLRLRNHRVLGLPVSALRLGGIRDVLS